MTLTARPRFLIRFAVLAALALCGIVLALSSTGTPPVGAQDGSLPAKPTGVVATATHDSVALAWDDPSDASITHYQIFRRDRDVHDAGEFVTIEDDTGSAAASYTDDTVEPETRYVYRVKAVNQHGASTWSDFVRADTPAAPDPADLAPSGLVVSLVGNRVTLTWDAPASDAASVTGYEILRRRPNDGEAALTTLVADTGNAETGYTDDTANEPGVRYTYRVKALRDGEQSKVSNYDRIDLPEDYAQDSSGSDEPTPSPEALVPSGLTAAVEDGGVALSWTAPAEDAGSVTGYEVLRAQGSAALTTLEADTGNTDTAYTDSGVTGDLDDYRYQVKALRGGDASQGSNVAGVLQSAHAGAIVPLADVTLISNLGQTPQGAGSFSIDQAQAFTTGSNSGGYSLTKVVINSSLGVTADFTVSVHQNNSGAPGTSLGTLTKPTLPDPDAAGNYEFTHSGIDLAASTTYFIVVDVSTTNTSFVIYNTNSDAEDTGGATGWSIGDSSLFRSQSSTGSWTTWAESKRISMTGTVKGGTTNSPATAGPTITGFPQLGKTLTADASTIVDPDGTTGATFTYQWVRSDDGTDTDINSATATTYTLVEADVGKLIKVKVSYTDDDDMDETATSEPVGPVGRRVIDSAGNVDAKGVWFETVIGGDFIIRLSDDEDDQVYGYTTGPITHSLSHGFDLHADNGDAKGIAAADGVLYVADSGDDKLFAYNVGATGTFGERLTSKEFALHADNQEPAGVWTDGETLYVVDPDQDKLYAYNVGATGTFGASLTDKDVPLHADNDDPWGVWSTGTVIWVADRSDYFIYAYSLSADGVRLDGQRPDNSYWEWALDTTDNNTDPWGMWSNDDNLWVLDDVGSKLFAYYLPLPSEPAPPTGVDITTEGNGELTVGWTAPTDDGGSAITGYTVQYRKSSDTAWTAHAHAGTATTTTITGLEASTSYQVHVLAKNAEGTSDWSASGTGSTGTSATVTLISNLGKFRNDGGNFTNDQAQAFTTGSNSGGYSLTKVVIASNLSTSANFTVSVHENDSGAPGTSLGTLTNPTLPATGEAGNYEFTHSGIDLAASTTYFIVVDVSTSSSFNVIHNTDSDAEDTGGATGWSIGDSSLYRGFGSTGSWTTWAQSKKISITGTVTGGTTNSPATGAPTISGTPAVGELLTADISNIGDSDGIADADFEYQWIAFDGTTDSDISGATGETYRPLLAHLNQTIKVRVTFDDDEDNAESLTSAPTTAVTASTYGQVIWAATLTVEEETVAAGTFFGFSITSRGSLEPYVFTHDGNSTTVTGLQYLEGGTLRFTFTGNLGSADFNLYLDGAPFLIETPGTAFIFSDHGLTWTDEQEVEVRLTVNRPATGAPAITGKPEVGETLTADISGIMDEDGVPADDQFAYQWISDDIDIDGATDSTYTLVQADAGKSIKVRVSFTDNAKFPESLTSAATTAVTVPVAALVSNVGQTATGNANVTASQSQGQGFTTGSDSGGYTLGSVELAVSSFSGTASDITVSIYSESSGDPGTVVHTLTTPASISTPVTTFTAPSGTTLAANTTYYVVISTTGSGINLSRTNAAAEDTGGASGWSIADDRRLFAGGNWVNTTNPIRMRVNGATTSTDIWSATLTVAEFTIEPNTYRGYTHVGTAVGELDPSTFSHDGDEITVNNLWHIVGGLLTFEISQELGGEGFLLRLGETLLPLGEPTGDPPVYQFSDHGVSWSVGDTVEVRLIPNQAATGAPVITGTPEVSQTLTADVSGIMDEDGLPVLGELTYQWISDGGDIDGATESTYWPSAGDVGNTITVRVSFTDNGNYPESLTSAATGAVAGPTVTAVPADWSLIPDGLGAGDQFRLLFLSSSSRNATPTSIATYNTWIQDRVDAGHTDIQDYTETFRAVGCTAAVDARDYTGTTYTSDYKGVPIYWLNGDKAADEYEDFYDETWDEEASMRDESGTTVSAPDPVWTGCEHDGTEGFRGGGSSALGSNRGVVFGVPNSDATNEGPLSGNTSSFGGAVRPFYGLSGVFQVSLITEVPADWSLVPSGLGVGDQFRLLFISSAHRNASPSEIATYNTWVQDLAASGHTDIQDYSSSFRAVGSTEDMDARDNTGTTYTSSDKGVAIYWLGGNKVADDYADFYDEDWDEEASMKNESGTAESGVTAWTGSDHDGTEMLQGTPQTSRALGNSNNAWVRFGKTDSASHGPLSGATANRTGNKRIYGLSSVFEVVAANNPATPAPRALVSNLGQAAHSAGVSATDSQDLAQGFTTGSRSGGYTLGSVELDVTGFTGTASDVTVSIYSESGNDPNTAVHVLTTPASISGLTTFTAPSNANLAADTQYYVVITTAGEDVTLSRTDSTADDAGGAAGWSIQDSGRINETGWTITTRPLRISIKGLATASDDATLSDLVLNDGTNYLTLTPTFASGMTSYTAEVAYTIDQLTLTPTKSDSNADVEYLDDDDKTIADADGMTEGQQVDLKEGANTIKVKVTAEDYVATETYEVTVTRETARAHCDDTQVWCETMVVGSVGAVMGWDEPGLVVGGALSAGDEDFDYGMHTYDFTSIFLSGSTLSIQFNAGSTGDLESRRTRDKLVFTVDGQEFNLGAGELHSNGRGVTWNSTNLTWATGETVALEVVEAEVSTVATLEDLVVNDGTNDLTLMPTFVSGTKDYTVAVHNAISRVTVTPELSHSWATVEYLDGSGNAIADADGMTEGQQVDLDTGANTIAVKVTAEDGMAEETYTVVVTRADPPAHCDGTEIWCETMTPGSSSVWLGWEDDGTYSGAALATDDENFDYGGHTYNLAEIALASTGPVAGRLLVAFDSGGAGDLATKATRDKLTLNVGGQALNFGDATYAAATRTLQWESTALTWTAGTDVALEIVEAPPSAPTNVLASGNAELTVTWDAPDNGGSAITGYTVQLKLSSVSGWPSGSVTERTLTGTPPARSHTFTGLSNGTEYTLRVKATNANGDSGWTEITATPLSGPGVASVTVDQASITQTLADVTRDGGQPAKRIPHGVPALPGGGRQLAVGREPEHSDQRYCRHLHPDRAEREHGLRRGGVPGQRLRRRSQDRHLHDLAHEAGVKPGL